MASHSWPTSDTSCTSAELGKDWMAQVNQRNQLQHDILEVSSYHTPDLQAFMFTAGGFSPSLPGIFCIPSVDTTRLICPGKHQSLPFQTTLQAPSSFCLIKQCKDKLSIHVKFIHYSDNLFLGCLLMKQTHTNPYNDH